MFMTVSFTHRSLALALLACLALPLGAAAQETFARAKELYVLASYDEALVVLNRLHESAPPPESSEIAGYQVFCLLALGRTDEANKAIEALVRTDPLYRPSASTTSPRMRAAFDAVRQTLLPEVVQQRYDSAKAAYDRSEQQAAIAQFDQVLTLLADPGLENVPNTADLRRLATGFRDLSKAALAPPPSPAATPNVPAPETSSTPPAPAAPTVAPAGPRTYGTEDADVVPPTAVSRRTPPWQPRNPIERFQQYRGVLEVVVDDMGNVASATVVKSVHPIYDRELVERARTWKFRPATRNGAPVRYRMAIEIRLGPNSP
jgi:TonB family protein